MSSRSIDPSSPSRLRLEPSSRIRGFEIPGRLGRLSGGPQSIATVRTGVVPPYPAVIRLSAEPSHHACRTLTAEGGHRDARASHSQPLHDQGPSGIRRSDIQWPGHPQLQPFGTPAPCSWHAGVSRIKHCLLKLNLRTSLFQLRLDFRGFVLVDASLTGLGAPSTKSLASLSPRPVIARTSLITSIFFSPAAASTTVNSVFSSQRERQRPRGRLRPQPRRQRKRPISLRAAWQVRPPPAP